MYHKIKFFPRLKPATGVFLLSLMLLVSCSKEQEESTYVPNLGSGTPSTNYTVEGAGEGSVSTGLNSVAESTAKNAVLRHSSVSEGEVIGYQLVENYDKGYLEYHIDFWKGNTHYFYTVQGSDGSILSFRNVNDENGYVPPDTTVETERLEEQEFTSEQGNLSSTEVRKIVAQHAGISTTDIYNFAIAQGYNGSIPQYQVTFATESYTYLYYIAANTGMIFSSDREVNVVADDPFLTLTPEESETTTPETSVPDTAVPESTLPTLPSTTPEATTPEVTAPETVTPETTTPSAPSNLPVYGVDEGLAG